MQKEAKARIKINKLLEQAGWRFFDDEKGKTNIALESNTKITQKDVDAFGNDFEKTKNGFIDFILLDEGGFPLVVLEAKSEDKNPLDGKEQARKYAKSENIRFILLSNGNLHYFWDLERGNPKFLYLVLKSQRDLMVKLSGGGAQPNISQSIIKKLKVPLPPISIQKEIVAEIEGYQKKIEEANQFIAEQECRIRERIEKVWGI